MKNSYLLLATLLLISVGCGEDAMEIIPEVIDEDQVLVDLIEEASFPLSTSPLSLSDNELAIFDGVADARIVGLGEATHGSREFFEMKERVFRYLVENHGYNAFLFEMDLAEARIFNEWVQGRREGDIADLMRRFMIFWTWRTEEVQHLLEWMRSYNQGKAEEDMIGFYGVDVQFQFFDLPQLAEIIGRVDASLAEEVRIKNDKYSNIRFEYQENFSDALVAEVLGGIRFAKSTIEDLEEDIVSQVGVEGWKWAKQLVRHMEQVQQVSFDFAKNGRYYVRDDYMAENVTWYFDLLGSDKKFVLWAHNGHVADDNRIYAPFGGAQGDYLKKEYGEDYQNVGFSFGKGSFSAQEDVESEVTVHTISDDPIEGSYNRLLNKTQNDRFILPLEDKRDELDAWLKGPQTFLGIGLLYNDNPNDFYRMINLKEHFDYIIHFDEVETSVLLN